MLKPRLSSIYRQIARFAKVKGPRELGDAARDRRDWLEAAEHYRRHLERLPQDRAIWVQLGHALKESGQLADAQAAYEEALRLDERDADLLLQLGHLHKLIGDDRLAASYYLRSSKLDGNPHAVAELNNLPAVLDQAYGGEEFRSRDILDLLAASCDGLLPTAASDIVHDTSGPNLVLTSADPWVVFDLDRSLAAEGGLGLLTIEAEPVDADLGMDGQVYFDHGGGFHEEYSLLCAPKSEATKLLLVGPAMIGRIRWDPDRKNNLIRPPKFSYRILTDPTEVEALIREDAPAGFDVGMAIATATTLMKRRDLDPQEAAEATLLVSGARPSSRTLYRRWISQYEKPTPADYQVMAKMEAEFSIKPKFSFVMPTYNTPATLLRECLDAMLAQTYSNFEICIADDNSPDPEVVAILSEYAEQDDRLKFVRRTSNGHISAASNSALRLATGDFIVLIDHDDLIPDYALFVIAHYINEYPEGDIFYSDEDKIDLQGRRLDPYFKSTFNKFLMYGHNMISHIGVYRASLVNAVGGFRLGFEGSQDYDLFLRCYELSADDRVIHIPHILYHWRLTPGSTAISADQKGYAVIAAQNAINGHFERTNMPLRCMDGFAPGCTGVKPARSFQTMVSIIIPTRNGLDLLKPCVESILKTWDENVEILIVDNDSDERETLEFLADLRFKRLATVIPYPGPFNFSLINNHAAAMASGEILCFLNNDTEVIASDWLDRARALLALDEVGIVGARLLFPDGALQHFGIVLGMGPHSIAGAPHLGIAGHDPGYFGKAQLLQEFSAVTAACMFVRKEAFERVGGFEPELTVAYNDVDLCLKVRALGLRILADPGILLTHKESKSRGSDKTGKSAARLRREASWMRKKWSQVLGEDPYYSPNLSLEAQDFRLAPQPRVPLPWRKSRPRPRLSAERTRQVAELS